MSDNNNNETMNKPLGLQRKPRPSSTNNAITTEDNAVNVKTDDEHIQNDDNLTDASSYKASQMFINEMMELAGPTLEVLRENGLDDSIRQLAAWRETMMSLGINPDNEDIRSAAIAALSMVSFISNDADTNDKSQPDDNGNTMPALSLILGLCENNVEAVTEYNAKNGFDIVPVEDDDTNDNNNDDSHDTDNGHTDNSLSQGSKTIQNGSEARLKPTKSASENNHKPNNNARNNVQQKPANNNPNNSLPHSASTSLPRRPNK